MGEAIETLGMHTRRAQRWWVVAAVLATAAASGCRRVEFYEREHLGKPLMEMEPDHAETYARQKILYSREGAAGGIGGGAGGGCGCY